MNIIFGLLSALLASMGLGHRKKALNESTLPNSLFMLSWPLSGFVIIGILLYITNVNIGIYSDIKIIGMILVIVFLDLLANFLELSVLKKTKLSEILPYTNLDKLFIVLIGFFLFFGTKNSTSITTLLITLVTILVIGVFSINLKNFKIPKSILQYSVVMLCRGIAILIVGFIFLKYGTIEYLSINMIFTFILYITIALVLKDSFKSLKQQSKNFYKSRGISLVLGWGGFILGLYIVKEAGILIATLISFVGLIFNVIAMKFILNDSPEKKQIVLAGLVTVLIGIGYYFK